MLIRHLTLASIALFFMPFPIQAATPIQKIKIKNMISKKDTSKTKFFMRHYPKEFTVKVNGKPINHNEETEINIPNKKFNVQYSYVWQAPWGKITGTKQVDFKINADHPKTINLDFSSWDDEYRIKASGAEPTAVKVIESSGSRKKPKKKK